MNSEQNHNEQLPNIEVFSVSAVMEPPQIAQTLGNIFSHLLNGLLTYFTCSQKQLVMALDPRRRHAFCAFGIVIDETATDEDILSAREILSKQFDEFITRERPKQLRVTLEEAVLPENGTGAIIIQ